MTELPGRTAINYFIDLFDKVSKNLYMKKSSSSRRNPVLRILITILAVLILIPAGLAGVSFIGRTAADRVLPGEYLAYIRIPEPMTAASHLLKHRALEKILADPGLASISKAAAAVRETGYLKNPILRFAADGPVSAAVYEDETFIVCYNTGILSPVAKLLPAVLSRMAVPDLYYVKAGKLSRFEFRPDEGQKLYFGPWKNLFIVTNREKTFESIVSGESAETASEIEPHTKILSKKYDAGILMDTKTLFAMYGDSDPQLSAVLSRLTPTDTGQAAVSIHEETLNIDIHLPIETDRPQLGKLLERESKVPEILDILPSSTQYATILSLGSLEELVQLAEEMRGDDISTLLRRANTSSSLLLGMNIEELLYSWSGEEMAAFGLTDRPRPVFAVKVADESKRKQVFDKLTSSFALTGDTSVVLDGVRIPRLRIPGFLKTLLGIWDIEIPAAYYLVEDGFLFFSESPENLLETIKANRRDTRLIRSDEWKILASGTPDSGGLSLFYSLERSVPFFLKGTDTVQRILQLYGKGLARAAVYDAGLRLSLSAYSSDSAGPMLLPGYPADTGGRLRNSINVIGFKDKDEKRILYVVNEKQVFSKDPVSGDVYSITGPDPLYCIPDEGLKAGTPEDPAVWIVSERGVVNLTDGNLNPVDGFPLATGVRLSSPPGAYDGLLYLSGSDGSMNRISAEGIAETVPQPYSEILRSPPVFIKTHDGSSIASYPKSFAGQIWLTDMDGGPRKGWPVKVSGIAFGSPVPITYKRNAYIAFLTQAGELSLFAEDGKLVDGFPVSLSGVFYIQPVFDGESLWTLSSEGRIYRVGLDAAYDSMAIQNLSAENGSILIYDIDGDKQPEIFVTGDGNILYGFTAGFSSLPGFPLPAWGKIWLGDLNGDDKTECLAPGMDNKIYGWQFH